MLVGILDSVGEEEHVLLAGGAVEEVVHGGADVDRLEAPAVVRMENLAVGHAEDHGEGEDGGTRRGGQGNQDGAREVVRAADAERRDGEERRMLSAVGAVALK